MLSEMPAHVLDEWQLFYQAEPRGDQLARWIGALLSWSIWESQRAKGARRPIADHLLKFAGDAIETSQEKIRQSIAATFQRLKARGKISVKRRSISRRTDS